MQAEPTPPDAVPAKKVLVVDDSGTFRRAIGEMLRQAGFSVDTASSGEEAFENCFEKPYDVVVSDITMGALSGVQLCRLLRSDPNTRNMPVVLLTAADDPRSRFWGRNAGAAAYVAKERARTELVPEVERVLNVAQTSMLPVARRAGRRAQPMQRLSEVLDQLLFRAVVSSEVRRLIHHTSDRERFCKGLVNIASEVADYSYLVLRLDGREGPTYTIHARAPLPEKPDPLVLRALQIPSGPALKLQIERETDEIAPPGTRVVIRDMADFPVEAASEPLGELKAFGARKRLGGEDRQTLELIATETGLLAKNVFLLEETRRLANSDALTGLMNRRRCTETLESELTRAKRYKIPFSVCICDVDHFKSVNDRFGHNMGDEVLREVARALESVLREADAIGRWGGEEFLTVMPETGLEGACEVAERMREAIASIPAFEAGPDKVTSSFGVAEYSEDANGAMLVDRSDQALYKAKEGGRNRVVASDKE